MQQARVFWRMNPGRNAVNLNWGAINADSVVMISASEYNPNSQQLPDTSDQRFVGAADIRVANVTPHGPPFDGNHGVTFVVEVDWNAPLNICTDITVVADAPNAVVYVGPETRSRQAGGPAAPAMDLGKPMPHIETSIEARVPTQQLSATIDASPPGAGSGGADYAAAARAAKTTVHEATVTEGSTRSRKR